MLVALIWLKDAAVALVSGHIALAEPVVFLLGFAESIAFLSLLVPSSVLFLAIGAIHSAAGGMFWPVWLAATAGAFLGDIFSYAAGRRFGGEAASAWPFAQRPKLYRLTHTFVSRWGVVGILGGKFFGMMRPFLPIMAGAMRMSWPMFLIASAVSSLLWAGAFLAPGYGISLLLR